MENQTPRPNFFKPTKRKMILPLIFLLLPLTIFLIYVPYLGYFFVLLLLVLCIPFNPLLEKLHLVIGAPGWFDMMGGPNLTGIIVVMILYAVIAYLIICCLAYLTHKNPSSPLSTDVSASSRTWLNRHPLAAVVIIIILALGGLGYFFKIPQKILSYFSQNETARWQTYTNETYHYSFQYPPDCKVGDQIQVGRGGTEMIKDDFVIIETIPKRQVERGFGIHITISHVDTEFFNPPQGTDLITWLNQKAYNRYYPNYPIPAQSNLEIDGLPAVYIDMPSEQSGHQADVYVLKEGKLFCINSMNVSTPEAREFFGEFLATIKF